MLRLALCDDMPEFLNSTKNLIESWSKKPDDLSISLFNNGDSLLEAHSQHPFDIILLDVIMPLLNGIETAAEIRKHDKSAKIIFLTSSAEYAIDSYSVKANNYLLKPVQTDKLYDCLNECYADILENAKSITIKNTTTVHRILLNNIVFVEAQGKHVNFMLSDGSSVISTEPFYMCENKLLKEDGFFKCHRSYVVNLSKVDSYSSRELTMFSGERIPIARSCQKEFEASYFDLIFGKAGDH